MSGKLDGVASTLAGIAVTLGVHTQRIEQLERARARVAANGWSLLLAAVSGNTLGAIALIIHK